MAQQAFHIHSLFRPQPNEVGPDHLTPFERRDLGCETDAAEVCGKLLPSHGTFKFFSQLTTNSDTLLAVNSAP